MSHGRVMARSLMFLEVCFWVVVYENPSAFVGILFILPELKKLEIQDWGPYVIIICVS